MDEVSDNAGPVSLNLNKMFSGLSFDAVEEVALGAGQAYSQASFLHTQGGVDAEVAWRAASKS